MMGLPVRVIVTSWRFRRWEIEAETARFDLAAVFKPLAVAEAKDVCMMSCLTATSNEGRVG
jgi:hypothetical protein